MMKRWMTLAVAGLVCVAGLGGCTTTAHLAISDARPARLATPAAAPSTADAEQAAVAAPLSADRRVQLGRLYLAMGRFASAESAFTDALTLDPSLGRIMISRALAQLAQGHDADARASLEQARGRVAEADLGLALAFAGARAEAIGLLEGVIRQSGGDVRTRQNLALVYGLEGRWADAGHMAARDVPADLLGDRLRRWAQIVQRGPGAAAQVQAMLGVSAVIDPGQPAGLALARPARSDAAPVMAAATPIVAPVARPRPSLAKAPPSGDFVVQLGAYHASSRLETAWTRLSARAAYLSAYVPAASQVKNRIDGGVLHRLAIGGFGTRAAAARICARIKADGGDCFVRTSVGDRPLQWVSAAGRQGSRKG